MKNAHQAHGWPSVGFFVFVCCVIVCGCADEAKKKSDSSNAALTPVTLVLNWFPEAEHGGYYAALVHGEYAKEGLDVTIVPGGTASPVIQEVITNRAQFGVETADRLLLGRAQDADVVAVMAPLQHSPRCILVHADSGIADFAGLKNVTLAVSPGGTFTQLLTKRLPLEGVTIVPYSGNVAEFLLNPKFAQQGFSISEPFVAKKNGKEARCLMASELGFDPYTSILLTTTDRTKSDPELVRKMTAASIRGWQKYLEAPEETNRYIHQQNPEMDVDILAFGAQELKPLCIDADTPLERIGRMTTERWQALADRLVEADVISKEAAHVDKAFTTQFLLE